MLFHSSPEALLSKRVISETEQAIRSRLKPLLDRAEVRANKWTVLWAQEIEPVVASWNLLCLLTVKRGSTDV